MMLHLSQTIIIQSKTTFRERFNRSKSKRRSGRKRPIGGRTAKRLACRRLIAAHQSRAPGATGGGRDKIRTEHVASHRSPPSCEELLANSNVKGSPRGSRHLYLTRRVGLWAAWDLSTETAPGLFWAWTTYLSKHDLQNGL